MRALILAVALGSALSLSCGDGDTFITLTVSSQDKDPPFHQVRVELQRQAGDKATLLFPPSKSANPLHFPATLEIKMPATADAVSITVTGLDPGGMPLLGGVGTASGVAVTPGSETPTSVAIGRTQAPEGIYLPCPNGQCAGGLTCVNLVGGTTNAAGKFCSVKDCQVTGDAADRRCDFTGDPMGRKGKCLNFADIGHSLCVLSCTSSLDCPTGAANTDAKLGCNVGPGYCQAGCEVDNPDCTFEGVQATCQIDEPMRLGICVP